MPRSRAYDFNSYAVGNKVYGGGRSFPTRGTVDKLGYRERDRKHKAKRNALLRRMKAGASKKYMSKDWLGGPRA